MSGDTDQVTPPEKKANFGSLYLPTFIFSVSCDRIKLVPVELVNVSTQPDNGDIKTGGVISSLLATY